MQASHMPALSLGEASGDLSSADDRLWGSSTRRDKLLRGQVAAYGDEHTLAAYVALRQPVRIVRPLSTLPSGRVPVDQMQKQKCGFFARFGGSDDGSDLGESLFQAFFDGAQV